MNRKRKRISGKQLSVGMLTLCVAAMSGSFVPATAFAASYADGTYTGTAVGYGGDITVSVTIQNGQITEIEPVEFDGETLEYWDPALETIDQILDAQSPDVDGVSGATTSSKGIKNAVADALSQANTEESVTTDASIFASGQGSEEDPFVIENADQLRAFADSVTMENSYTDYVILLSSDLDLSGQDWSPIGGADAFNGTFDGDGHTISGLTMGSEETPLTISDDVSNVGFFGNLGGSSVVRNLVFQDVRMNVYHPGLLRVGVLAGATSRGDGSGVAGPVIDSVDISGDLTVKNDDGNIWAGGYVGMLFTGSVINCTADIDVYALSSASDPSFRVTNWVEAGGITGLNFWGEIVNTATLGDVTAGCIRREADEATAADNKDALENGPKEDEEISEAICAVGAISGLDLGHTENVYTAGNVTAIGNCECISSTVGYSEETHSEDDFEYTFLNNVWVDSDVKVDNDGTPVDIETAPRFEDGAQIGTITVADDKSQLADALNAGVETMQADEETIARMQTFGSDASMLRQWVLDEEIPVPKGELH